MVAKDTKKRRMQFPMSASASFVLGVHHFIKRPIDHTSVYGRDASVFFVAQAAIFQQNIRRSLDQRFLFPVFFPQLGVSQTQSSPLPAKVSGPQGPPRLTPYFPAPNPGPLRLVVPCLSAVSLTSSQPLPVTSAFCLAQCLARSIKSIPIPLSFLSLSPRFPPSPPLFPTPTFWLPSVLAASFPSSRADFLGLFWPCKVFLFLFGLLVGSWFPPQWKCRVLLGPPGNSL